MNLSLLIRSLLSCALVAQAMAQTTTEVGTTAIITPTLPQDGVLLSVDNPLGGSATIIGSTIEYVPDAGFAGYETLNYQIDDGGSTIDDSEQVSVVYPITDLWVPFNEGENATAHDAGGHELGTLANPGPGTLWKTAPNGLALSFDGSDDQIAVDPLVYTPPLGSAARTITAWLKVPAVGSSPALGSIVSWGDGTSFGSRWTFGLKSSSPGTGAIQVDVGNGHVAGSTDLRDGQWHHVAAVLPVGGSDVTDCLLYVNGNLELVSSSTSRTVSTSLSAPLLVGNNSAGEHFQGLLDELHIRGVALTITQISDEASAVNQAGVAWHTRYFGPAVIDWDADDDNDGVSRLQEYAFAGNPHLLSPEILPALSFTDDFDYLTFSKPVDGRHNIEYVYEESTDLAIWADFEAIPDEDDIGPYPGTESVLLEAGDHISPKRFLRVRTELLD